MQSERMGCCGLGRRSTSTPMRTVPMCVLAGTPTLNGAYPRVIGEMHLQQAAARPTDTIPAPTGLQHM